MSEAVQPDGKNSLLGEFLVALTRSPEPIQEAIILFGLKQMSPYAKALIQPYPMLSHLKTIVERNREAEGEDQDL
jgi:hypothetical protein